MVALHYGPRDDFMRALVKQRFGIRVGKYSYGYRPLCTRQSKIGEIGAFCSIATEIKVSGGNHPLDLVSTSPATYLEGWGSSTKRSTAIIPRTTRS